MTPPLSQNSRYLLDVLRAVLEERPAPAPYEGVSFSELFAAADVHKLAPMVYHGLYRLGLPADDIAPFLEAHRKNMLLSIKQEGDFKRLSDIMNGAGLDHCFLKGRYTRELYPDPTMRGMSDIDLLVKKGCRAEAKALLEENGYECVHYDISDDDRYRRNGVSVEIHDGLDADGLKNPSYYDDPMRLMEKLSLHEYRLTPEHEYLYTAAHALKHFMNSGAGIRFLIDIYLYMTKAGLDMDVVRAEAEKMGIEKFLSCMEKTASAAFGDGGFDEDSSLVFMFMMENGIGGTSTIGESSLMIGSVNGKPGLKRSRYLFRRLFPEAKQMKRRDPILKKAPVLLPVMYVRRWFQLLFSKRERVRSRMSRAGAVDAKKLERLCRIYEIAGVNKA